MESSRNDFNLKGKKAEQLVYDLALKTFLTDWCFRNPKLPNAKELCDLLVVYDEVAVIWQVKDLILDEDGRYRTREVDKNLRQLSGARRQLFTLKAPVELENPHIGRVQFDATGIKEVYLVSILLGEGEGIFSFVEYIKNHTVHVFTRDFTQLILSELDTVNDFISYLRAKEALISQNKHMVILGGEEELLAIYLMNNRSFDRLKDATHIMINQGSWEQFRNSRKYREKKRHDEISYGWDNIINHAHGVSPEYEVVARELARPNRFERRMLSKAYMGVYIVAASDKTHKVFRRTIDSNEITYCFLFTDSTKPKDYRKGVLQCMCYIARGKFKSNRKVIGIASEIEEGLIYSYDFVLLDMPEWTEQNQREMEKMQQETGILSSPDISIVHEDEYLKSAND